MSEHLLTLRQPAQALARWTVLLMGWVWLGEQGQRIGWSMASGLLAVALWWALRLLFAARPSRIALPAPARAALGAATAAGALLVAQTEPGATAQALLLALAVLWAAWSATLEAAGAAPRCRQPWAGWPPVIAALVTWAAIARPDLAGVQGLHASAVLLGTAITGATTPSQGHASPTHPLAWTAASLLPQTAMGLMMGSLWLGSAWCTSAGWSSQAVVGLHLLLMTGLPALTRRDLVPRVLPPRAAQAVPLALILLGSLVLLMGDRPAHGIAGMGLLALAWALHGGRHAMHPARTVSASRRWAALGGPLLLLAVGVGSPTLGPQALTQAHGLLGALAFAALLRLAWRASRSPLPVAPKPSRNVS
ncbi:MAG: hypothetical protein U1D36_18455 [Hydrogenophaga sp.]|jgi:hypothetical protein|uniref:hypothetical protein n=1 Tax=Comamonadaceae TaxID=80864 RepID=UPI002730B7B8|nr:MULTISPECIES: hypothetical protein [Comamonadaceae]MDP2442171.1 hypothetical protein [Rhodoferax sp.]MDZ4176439.1 hypothetical protein [Hydrogenophaga sp.]